MAEVGAKDGERMKAGVPFPLGVAFLGGVIPTGASFQAEGGISRGAYM